MEKEKNTNNIPEVDASKFVLVNKDKDQRIHDQKFETRPTTFARDAFKRFCKNKSSVAGAIIIGALLTGSFLSFLSPYDIRTAQAYAQKLPGKVFEAGSGFWDGCLSYSKVAYDEENETPVGFKKKYCYELEITDYQYANQYFAYAKGGYLRPTCKVYYEAKPEDKIEDFEWYLRSETFFTVNKTNEFKINIHFGDVDNIGGDQLCDSYCIYIRNGKKDDSPIYLLKDWSNEFGDVNLDVSSIINTNFPDVTSLNYCQLFIKARPKVSKTVLSYFMLDKLEMTSNDDQDNLKEISITDANYTAGLKPDNHNVRPTGYWASTGVMNVYQCRYKTSAFRYDHYGDVFGDQADFKIGGSLMKEYIAKGWCKYDDFSDINTFKVLNKTKCPVKKVTDAEYISGSDTWEFTTVTTIYKYKGYDEMPKFIFGTDAQGHDLLTVAFSSLKTSLLVAIVSSAVCLVIGLIWGSISGYFGGNVDIIMERITDILGGVPWIVMMTLIILLLGNNIVTFAIALIMTGWIGTSSRTRTQFYRFKGREYILASRTLGASDTRLIFRHILPNGLGTIVTGSVLMIPGCIFSEATISYLGLGLQGVDSFGVLLSENQQYIESRPLLVVVPAIIISLLMISFNLFGNGLRDALNPTLKGGE